MSTEQKVKRVKTRKELEAAHGRPSEFARAVRNAIGEISYEEAERAIDRYMAEWNHAP